MSTSTYVSTLRHANPNPDEQAVPDDDAPSTERAPLMGTRAALDYAVSQLGPDEQRTLTRIAERLSRRGRSSETNASTKHRRRRPRDLSDWRDGTRE